MGNDTPSLMRVPEGAAQAALPAVLETQSVAAAASAKAEVEAAYTIAINRPRSIEKVRVNLLDACKRSKFAQKALYEKPVGGQKIEGLSIRAAEEIIREMGNLRISQAVTFENATERKVRISVTDMEVNSGYTQEITIQKTVERSNDKGREVLSTRENTYGKLVYIVKATDDELMNKESSMVSKVLRNAALRLTPSDILEEMVETIKATLRAEGDQDPEAQKKKTIDAFHEYGVDPGDIEEYLGHSLGKITPAELETLKGMYRAIRDDQSTWQAFMDNKADASEKPDVD